MPNAADSNDVLYQRTTIEVDILGREQFDGHIVDGHHLLFQHDSSEERIDAAVTLHEGMLGDQERNGAFAQASRILVDHIVAHDLYVATVVSQQIGAHEMGP